jgi:hypothetical protein
MEVVERFELVLDAQAAPAQGKQIEIVLQHLAEVGIGIRNSELVAWPRGEKAVAAETDVKERRNRTGILIRKGYLPEETPTISSGSLHDVLPKGVIDRP